MIRSYFLQASASCCCCFKPRGRGGNLNNELTMRLVYGFPPTGPSSSVLVLLSNVSLNMNYASARSVSCLPYNILDPQEKHQDVSILEASIGKTFIRPNRWGAEREETHWLQRRKKERETRISPLPLCLWKRLILWPGAAAWLKTSPTL